MTLENHEGGRFITIYNGKFSIRVPEGTPGAKDRVNKIGNTVFEKFYDSFTAKLVNIRTRESKLYGKSWNMDFRDGEEVYTLQLPYSNSYAVNFLKILPNVDLTKEMKIQPNQKIEDGKTRSSLFVSQDGVTLKHAYTKDNPNGLPPLVQVMRKGKLEWDDSDRLVFLQAMVERDILPKLPKDAVVPMSKADEAMSVDEHVTADDNDF